MLNIVSVFIGGGIGSVLRYLVNITFGKTVMCQSCALPLATLCVNIFGSFVLGFAYAFLVQRINLPQNLKLALTVGFCGGLTTFSTFSLEAFDLIKNGEILIGSGYILLSAISCIIAVGFGIFAGGMSGAYFAK